jgi:signal transduction histidine kinase/CheY-like chemotaxis protein/AraC-like DNA-binding protein
MTLDRSGLIWVGTSGFGLYRINPNQRRFTHQLSGISIRHISVVSAEELFLLSYTNDFWYKQDGRLLGLQLLPDDSSTLDHENMLISKSGDYWIRQGSSGQGDSKLIRHNPQTKTNKIYDISWHHNDFQPMIECQDGAICMAGNNSLITYINPVTNVATSFSLKNGERIINPNEEERIISYENSTALYEDGDGVLWVGTEHGFTKFIRPSSTAQSGKSLQITRYQNIVGDPTSLSYNHVTCFLEDPIRPDRYLWVCTKGGGINRMDKASETFLRYSKKDGLPNNVVYGILADDDGNIWGSTNKGLFCMIANKDVASNKQDYFFRNFSKADGLQENEFNTGAYVKLPDGRLLFGGINGYNVFDPKEILTDSYTPNTFITNILVNNQKVSTGDETGILEHTIETTKSITLTHLQDILTLEFATLDFNAPDQNKYRYQLVGADDTWVEAGNRRSATFLNLQPNDYTFRVQGSNSQGVWSEHIAELQISILPPWWKTWWAYFLYATLILSAIWTYFRFSINRAKLQQQLAFEKREADRVRDLDALKTQLYMNMTHEFRTPLTIILGMAQQVMDNPKEHFNGGMNMIINNSRNLLNLINKMLNLSKLESGKMSLELVQGDVALFLRNLVESFRSYAAKKEILLHFLPEVDSVMMDFDADKLQQVVSNLISNAFKFTPEGGNIYFNLRKENSSLVIRVKDTGRGIPQRDLENVFDRFYQVDNSTTRKHEGSGIGLALSKELVTLMKGTISVQSPPIGSKKGSEFMVVLPIYKEGAIEESDLVKNQLAKPVLMKIENEESVTTVNGAMDESKNTSGTANQQLLEENIKPLILLAEDNEDVAAFVASCLPDDYRLAIAENGQEGLEIAIEIIPDLIISDVMMPVMDGFEFCQKLKSDKRTDHIPVIILTARADMDSKLEGLKLGANAYLPKPFEKNELLLTIKNLFGLRDKLRRHYQNIAGLGEQEEVAVDHSETPKPEDEFVIRVREIIEAHIDDFDFNVQQLAKELHLSHSQFGRKLDALTGYSPSRFIRFARLKKAKDLLQNPDLSITAIAYDCGFNDPSYFTRVFKKEFGKTPNDWRMDAAM